jgi:hypothetical protein
MPAAGTVPSLLPSTGKKKSGTDWLALPYPTCVPSTIESKLSSKRVWKSAANFAVGGVYLAVCVDW